MAKNKDQKPAEATDLAPSTHAPGEQTVDKDKDQALPMSKPDEIAPTLDAAGNPTKEEPEASKSGYRIAKGKSLTSLRGDLLDAGAEVSDKDVGGDERLKELVTAGVVVETKKGSSGDADDGESQKRHGVDGNAPESHPADVTPAEKLANEKKSGQLSPLDAANNPSGNTNNNDPFRSK